MDKAFVQRLVSLKLSTEMTSKWPHPFCMCLYTAPVSWNGAAAGPGGDAAVAGAAAASARLCTCTRAGAGKITTITGWTGRFSQRSAGQPRCCSSLFMPGRARQGQGLCNSVGMHYYFDYCTCVHHYYSLYRNNNINPCSFTTVYNECISLRYKLYLCSGY